MTSKDLINVHSSWNDLFVNYVFDLDSIYNDSSSIIYPNRSDVFNAFSIPVTNISVVFLGQDVYHDSSATGYAFSCNKKIPPSLRNIFKEIKDEFPERNYNFNNGNIEAWSNRENIFLLNCALTVKKSTPLSHMDIWSEFTDDVIKYINTKNPNCVYLLLGNFAKSKAQLISNKLNIVRGTHPSPFSAHNGFFGSNIFKNVETILDRTINWQN